MSKKLLRHIFIFSSMVLFLWLFNAAFGDENSMIGIVCALYALMLMPADLTKDFLKNLFSITLVNLILVMLSYISCRNIYIGLITNFLAIGGIGYFLSHGMDKVFVAPFGIGYIFMTFIPVEGKIFFLRILGLISGSVFTMMLQSVLHRKTPPHSKTRKDIFPNFKETEGYIPLNFMRLRLNVHVIRSRYALRVGIVTSIAIFIVKYLNIPQGKWIILSLFSITELYAEKCRVKSKMRLSATIIGCLIAVFLFSFIKSSEIRTAIMLASGYMSTYTENYKIKMIYINISAIASAALNEAALPLIAERVIYVFIGVLIALFVNRFLLYTPKN